MAQASGGNDRTHSPTSDAAEAARPDAVGPHDEGQLPGGTVDGGSAGDRRAIDLDDDEIYSGRGNGAAKGGTTHAPGGDSGRLGPPSEQLSDRNEPSDRRG